MGGLIIEVCGLITLGTFVFAGLAWVITRLREVIGGGG